jgi:hypothetical protein
MSSLHAGNLDKPEETRTFDNGKFEVIKLGDTSVGRSTFEPGWKWSEAVKPIAGTDTCQKRHVGYVVSGRLHVVSDDGDEAEVGPGDAFVVMPGHDAWVVGDEQWIAYEFESAADYAK